MVVWKHPRHMPGAFHSEQWKKSWTAEEIEEAGLSVACGCGVMPAKNCSGGGGAWAQADETKEDIIDETLKLFRAQVFFKNFEVHPRAQPSPDPLLLNEAVPHTAGAW